MKRTIILLNKKKSEKRMPKFIFKKRANKDYVYMREKKTVDPFTKWWPAKESSVK